MQFFKSKNQTPKDVAKSVELWWENQNFPADREIIDDWDQAALKEIREIQLSTLSMSEKEKETQRKIRWSNWLKQNPKPLILDKIERYDLSRGIKPLSKEQLEELKNFENFKWSKEDMEKTVDLAAFEEFRKKLSAQNKDWFKNYE